MLPSTCPTEEQMRAFQLGDLPGASLDQVAEHLETCRRCETMAQRLDNAMDPIVAALRDPSASSVHRGSPNVATRPVTPVKRSPEGEAAYPFFQPAALPDEIGRLGHYRVLRLLGKGGMAYVFHAEDLALRRPVALKIMKPDLSSDLEGWQRFLREARIMASIKHENLATVFQAGQEGDVVYLAMELLHGESLENWIERVGAGAAADVVRLGGEIASGLVVIHQNGLIHRDVKPANLWLDASGRVKILDFGLARHLNDDANLTRSGTVMGTPAFMSPEQARGDVVDARSDLFSLGCVLYCLCTGKKPFEAANTMAALTALAVETPRPVHELNPAMPRALSDLVMQLLAKDAGNRPDSAAEVLARIRQIAAELVEQPPTSAALSLARPVVPRDEKATAPSAGVGRRRWRLGVAIGLGAVTLLVVLLVVAPRIIPIIWPPPSPPPGNTLPATPLPEGVVFLSDLPMSGKENHPFPGYLPPPPGEKPEAGGPRVRVQGKLSPHGIFMHGVPDGGAVSIRYRLDKQFRTFQAGVSLNDGPPRCTPMTFSVYGDGRLLWQSKPPISSQAGGQELKIPVHEVVELRIEVTFQGNVMGTHAVWIEPSLTR